ncbi:O-acetylhomoserine aminocarboxypropyltransferase/cysteine synthase family protein [Campylobacter concisus]|uniref:O-acetylhomoserine aminocarboxypropyltransferase/cysteine synthase family protein n=1 Tax=Campylobacter concisus TaxID=199 RepID=UPI003D1B9B55
MKQETAAIHVGYDTQGGFGTMAVPIFQSTAYDFGSAETAAARFDLKDNGHIYTRLGNPTTDIFEKRVAALECGAAAIATASGQSALFYSIINLAQAGDNIIIAKKIYGGTTVLFTHTLKRFGIEARVFDSDTADDLEGLIDDKTRAIFFETLSNPQISIPNIEKIVEIANKYGIISITDNTVPTPIIFQPLRHGVDVCVHSASKYISGQGLSLAGVVVSANHLNEKLKGNKRYEHFNTPDASYHDIVYADMTDNFDIYTLRMRLAIVRDIGAVISPFNSWQLIQGLETLAVRVERHSQNALKVAKFLKSHKYIKSVAYPGLADNVGHAKAQRYFKDGMANGLFCFETDSFERAKKMLERVKLFKIVVNIGDTKSLITHPASTTHQQLSSEELIKAGITKELIRVSIGLENAEDLIADLAQALE